MTGGAGARVVVVHWNRPTDCVATVGNVLTSTLAVRVTVVDNASRATDRALLGAGLGDLVAAGRVEILDAPRNLGFGPGANLGIERFLGDPGDGEWMFLVPHDVRLEPSTVEKMLTAAAHVPSAGLCCGDVGDSMSPVFDPYFGGMVVPGGEREGWEPVDYPHGTLMGLRRACLEEIGAFDERFFSYCEEADLGLRARRRGWQVGLVRGAAVRNTGLGSSVWTVDYLQTRNTLLLVKEASGRYHALVRICFTVAQILRGALSKRSRPAVFDARARVAGVRDFMLRRFGPPPPR